MNNLHDRKYNEVLVYVQLYSNQLPLYKTDVPLASFCRVVLEADPFAAAFAIHSEELFLRLTVDADQISSSGHTVLVCSSPALLMLPVHIVEELQ